jgi:hypothetical protein
MKFKFHHLYVSCPHKCGDDPTVKLPDYHPLDKDNVSELLWLAKQNSSDFKAVNLIQIRLDQGIKGSTCPRTRACFGSASTLLAVHFMDNLEKGGVEEEVRWYMELYADPINNKAVTEIVLFYPHDTIERLRVNASSDSKKDFGSTFDFLYMGSAESEFGAPKESMERIFSNLSEYKIHKVPEILNHKEEPLRYFFPYKNLPLERILLAKSKDESSSLKTKERLALEHNLNEWVHEDFKTDAWWDIKNNVFFFFGKRIQALLLNSLNLSVEKSQ